MSTEIESGLPVRSYQDTVDERVLTKIQDGDSPGAAGSTTQVSEKKLHVRNHSKDSDGTDREQLLSQEGHALTNGDYDGTLNKRPSSQGQILHDRKNTAEDPAEADQNKRPTAVKYDNGVDETVVCADVAIRDEDGVPFSKDNPLPVSIEESEGDEVHEFHQTPALAKNATDIFDYNVTAGKELELEMWAISASGFMQAILQVETGVGTGVFEDKDYLYNSTAEKADERMLKRPIKVGAGVKVRIVFENWENKTQTLQGFINGLES